MTADTENFKQDSTLLAQTATPAEICLHLDDYVVGQAKAKRALAIALRNRWRRLNLPEEVATEITPKNLLMIGPTGVGKTELARRMAKLVGSPFLKVDATRFTEVGYVGRDVESIIRDLVESAYLLEKEKQLRAVRDEVHKQAEDQLLERLMAMRDMAPEDQAARESLRQSLRRGDLDEERIIFDAKARSAAGLVVGPPGMEDMTQQIESVMKQLGSGKTEKRNCTLRQARKLLEEEAGDQMTDDKDIAEAAVAAAESSGVVFLDEIDKVCGDDRRSADVSRMGVQRDLLPLIEGCQVATRLGQVRTHHILFIASGAFHMAKPSDLVPELQGRLPIRVQLSSLSATDLSDVLVRPRYSLCQQYFELLKVEDTHLTLTPDAIRRIGEIAFEVNANSEDIGARRLHTLMEHLLEKEMFEPPGGKVKLDQKQVDERLGPLLQDGAASWYIL